MKKSSDKWKTALPSIEIDTKPIHDAMQMGIKHDQGKPPIDLIPYDAIVEIAKVLQFGANKYSRGEWSKGIEFSRLISSAERHIGEFKENRDMDPESNLPHIAHAACNLLFILWFLKHKPELDNRWTKK